MDIDSLLSQATCAVLDGSSRDGGGNVVGTAWLAKDSGHLLTAGHVVKKLSNKDVWVRFPDDEHNLLASCVIEPVHEKSLALDFAILKLNEDTSRQPLPFTLVSSVEGSIRARGYGSNLPQSQHSGTGQLLGAYKRDNSSSKFLFQYESRTLAVEGFSGAAVYSDTTRAVVGLQVEQERGETAFAMPMARITDYWGDLLSAALKPRRGLAVLLIPESRTKESKDKLIDEIILPVLDELNLELYTSLPGRATGNDLAKLDRADVVIADVSHGDANVVYELTVAHGIGTPDVIFADSHLISGLNQLPFSQIMPLDLEDVANARKNLERRLVSVRAIFEALGEPDSSNPITEFYSAPLTQISVANALAIGYEVNFVRPVGTALLEALAGLDCRITVGGHVLDAAQVQRLSLTVVLPEHLSWADDDFIHTNLQKPNLVVPAIVEHPNFSRPRTMKALPLPASSTETIQLLDTFPTTLATMAEAIDQRLGLSSGHRNLPSWRAVEAKEIDRFGSRLRQRINIDPLKFRGRRLNDICRVTTTTTTFPTFSHNDD